MEHLAFCGDDCSICPRYTATQGGDIAGLRKAAEIWYAMGVRDVIKSPEDMFCHGCLTIAKCTYGIRECAQGKGVDNCGRCDDYPCDRVQQAFEKTKGYELICQARCAQEDYNLLQEAFFKKKEKLDAINEEYCKQGR